MFTALKVRGLIPILGHLELGRIACRRTRKGEDYVLAIAHSAPRLMTEIPA
jgi:hypothetical protein